MILAATAVLAENWTDISDYFANGLPDLIAQPAGTGNEENETDTTVFERYVIEQIYAPVRMHMLNGAGEEVFVYDFTPQVARTVYHYALHRGPEGTGFQVPDPIEVTAPDCQDGALAMSPFPRYLFCDGKIEHYEFSTLINDEYDEYRIDFKKTLFTISYLKFRRKRSP